MADNVPITAGVGTDVMTDQVAGGAHVQYVKLLDGTADSVAVIPGTAANGIDVDVTRMAALVAGEAHAAQVGGHTLIVTVTPTLTVNATYVAGDYVGTDHTAMSFSVARVNAGSGTVISALLVSYVVTTVACELWLFDVTPAGLPDDSAAFTITDADALTCIGVIPFNTYYASALNSISRGEVGLGIPFVCGAGVKTIFGAIVTRGAPAWETDGDISIRLGVLQD